MPGFVCWVQPMYFGGFCTTYVFCTKPFPATFVRVWCMGLYVGYNLRIFAVFLVQPTYFVPNLQNPAPLPLAPPPLKLYLLSIVKRSSEIILSV